jgi:hypothetical protein
MRSSWAHTTWIIWVDYFGGEIRVLPLYLDWLSFEEGF